MQIKKKSNPSSSKHPKRCKDCKETIKRLLEKIYGEVEENYKFEKVGTHPKDFKNIPHYHKLKEIYDALQNNYGGCDEIINAKTLPPCDFFIPDPGFIVEYDESQHFTAPRKIALEKYPCNFEFGFSRKKWIELCEKIDAKDNNPPYRDEQRAWYDTLRDFLPEILGLKPTVRLYDEDLVWCDLDPENPQDVEKFKKIIENKNERWKIEVREDQKDQESFCLSRIIIANEWEGKPADAKCLLEKIYEKWPEGKKVKFIITCGGFIQLDWPNWVSKAKIGDNKKPNPKAISYLVQRALKCVKSVLTKDLVNKLKTITDYITLGVDFYQKNQVVNRPHIELVFLVDLRNNKFCWTGKSYPTSAQENHLVRISNLKSHFFNLDIGKTMILGCHDLTIFNPRSEANAGQWRKEVIEEFKKLAKNEKPKIVLQHPHTTVKKSTWSNAWKNLCKSLPSVEIYASAGRYHDPKCSNPDDLDEVLKSTKKGVNTIDIIIEEN